MVENVSLLTVDGVRIVGTFVSSAPTHGAVLLLHMMPATKESWTSFAESLRQRGLSSLAIDLRGHGASVVAESGARLDYKLFEDVDHQDKRHDVAAALAWLQTRGFSLKNISVVGASIGANLAIVAAADYPEIRAAAALSPGLDYRGVTTPDQVCRLRPAQALLLAASVEDELSFQTDRELVKLKSDAVIKEFRDAGHGTTMFDRQPGFSDELADWLAAVITK